MDKKISPKHIREFQEMVYANAKKRTADFPWRKSITPYKVLVSEIMLQQTQAERVTEKFIRFIVEFPTIAQLASTPQEKLLTAWQGLGYNRRALMLQRCAQSVMQERNGSIPCDEALLQKLPGIGPYTASAIMAFAHNKPAVVIETNIRRVFIHHFFADQTGIHDKQLIPLIRQTIDTNSPRKWYSALMDYGAYLKTQIENPNRRSAHYAKQSKFKGSLREVRGKILRTLLTKQPMTAKQLKSELQMEDEKIEKALNALIKEGFLKRSSRGYLIKQPANSFILHKGSQGAPPAPKNRTQS